MNSRNSIVLSLAIVLSGLACDRRPTAVGSGREAMSVEGAQGPVPKHAAHKHPNIPNKKLKCKLVFPPRTFWLSEPEVGKLVKLLNDITSENGYSRYEWPAHKDRRPGADLFILFYDSQVESGPILVQVEVWETLGGVVGFSGQRYYSVGEDKVRELIEIIKQDSSQK